MNASFHSSFLSPQSSTRLPRLLLEVYINLQESIFPYLTRYILETNNITSVTMGVLDKVKIPKPNDEAGASWPAIAMGFFVAFGGVLYG